MKKMTLYFLPLVLIGLVLATYFFYIHGNLSVNLTKDSETQTISGENVSENTASTQPESEVSSKSSEVKKDSISTNSTKTPAKKPTPPVSKNNPLLFVGKITPGSVFEISQSANIEPRQIPFKVMTYLDNKSVSSYLPCITILKSGVRASETDCESFDKNLDFDFDTKIGENLGIDTKIGITDLNLAPYPLSATYPEGTYISIGVHQLEIVISLVKDDPSLIYKISGDTSSDLNLLKANTIAMESTGEFLLRVTK